MQINEIKAKLDEIKSRNNPSVYTRIVGYYRPVQNFNISKKEEYKDRTMYQL